MIIKTNDGKEIDVQFRSFAGAVFLAQLFVVAVIYGFLMAIIFVAYILQQGFK